MDSLCRSLYLVRSIAICTMVKDKELIQMLKERFDRLLAKEQKYLPPKKHVDLNIFGCLALELYQVSKDKKIFGVRFVLC